MSFFDLFIGSEQSKYAAIAIISVIFVICMSFLITNTDISVSERFFAVMILLFIVLLPACLALFELTCIVNGDSKNSDTYCGYYAWAISLIIIIQCVIIIVSTFSSMFVYKKALVAVDADKQINNISPSSAKQIAENMMNFDEKQNKQKDISVMPQAPVQEPFVQKVPVQEAPVQKVPVQEDTVKPVQSGGEIEGIETGDYASIE